MVLIDGTQVGPALAKPGLREGLTNPPLRLGVSARIAHHGPVPMRTTQRPDTRKQSILCRTSGPLQTRRSPYTRRGAVSAARHLQVTQMYTIATSTCWGRGKIIRIVSWCSTNDVSFEDRSVRLRADG